MGRLNGKTAIVTGGAEESENPVRNCSHAKAHG